MLEIEQSINKDLEAVESIMREQFTTNSFAAIAEVGQHIFKNGGKRLRPRLLLLAARANQYESENMHYMAAVIELMHTATLLHDDVIDLSSLRRNQLTAHEIWGNKTSILVGDFMFTRALELTAKHADQNWAITELLAQTLNQITVGEVAQLQHHANFSLDETTYFQIIENKTAVLFAAACEIAGLLAKVSTETQQALRSYGLNLGIAFQLIDDLLDYASDTETLGKEIGDDLAEGKTTLPLIHLLSKIPNADEFKQHIKQAGKSQVQEVVNLMKTHQSIAYTRNKANEYIDNALTALTALPESPYRSILEKIASDSLVRTQ